MSDTVYQSFPLEWPVSYPRTPAEERHRARYQVTADKAMVDLLRELRLLGATNVVVSSNVPTRKRDKMMLTSAANRNYDDPGVAVYFTWKGEQKVIPCDCWLAVKDNLRAIGMAVAALRDLERCGAGEIQKRAFVGFRALPPPLSRRSSWWEVLGVSQDATLDEVRAAHRKLAQTHHPDVGGSLENMQALNQALTEAMQHLNQ